jgi:lysophospholipase L1-like esterase
VSRTRAPSAFRPLALAAAALLGGACGGSSSPGGPNPVPTPPVEVHDVTVRVFYDEDGNGALDGFEQIRLPDVVVEAGGRSAQTARGTGLAVISGVPRGQATVSIRADSLPPYFVPPAPISVDVPQASGQELRLPVTLPIGTNRPNRYMAFGDSITSGDGSSRGNGYRDILQDDLMNLLGGQPILVNEGQLGTKSNGGADRIVGTLGVRRPAYTLILYGTNDWNDCRGAVPCYTIDSLRNIVEACRGAQSMPILATIIPANPDYPDQVPPERNAWIHDIDALVRSMAHDQGVAVADAEAAFLAQPKLTDLFSDHVHPNDAGYVLIEQAFLKAITQARGGSSTSLEMSFFFRPSGRKGRR